MFTRFNLLLALAAALPCMAQEAPNILLIVADDMGYGDLSCYGSLQIQTPNLDRLAAQGVRCTDGYVSGPVCAPSRAGLMTGRYGSRFGFEHNLSRPAQLKPEFAGIPLDEPLVSQRLHDLGYRTGMVGKWHLGESLAEQHPNRRGFDFFFGMLGGSHPYWPTVERNHLLYGEQPPSEIRTPYLTDWFTLEAIDFMLAEDGREPAPWFLYLAYNTPHAPMQAKEEDLAKYADVEEPTRRIYCAMQSCLDENIGRILSALESSGQLHRTFIVFISDNGGSVEVSHAVNAPLRGTKGTFLEGGIRVPTIFFWPDQLEPRVYRQPVIALDLMATFVAAAGGRPPAVGVRLERPGRKKKKGPIYDSVNLLPFLKGEVSTPPHQRLFWRMALRGSAMREGDWKWLRPNSQPIQLYNLADDPSELHDLAAQHPDLVRKMLGEFNAWEAELERNPLFISAPTWSAYNRRLYEKEYTLTQPSRD